jgi:hypothetical protein
MSQNDNLQNGKGCLGITATLLVLPILLVGITFSSMAKADPVTEFVDTQKNYFLGMASGAKMFAQAMPVTEENKAWFETEAYKTAIEADKTSSSYQWGLFTGSHLVPYVIGGGAQVLRKP